MGTPTDTLLTRLQAGDEGALAELIDKYGSKIYRLAFRYLRNKEDAEEITQDVLFKVYRKVGAFRGDAALSSWIYRITFNTAMSRLRTASYQRSQADDAQVALFEGDEATGSSAHEIADWSSLADEGVFRAQLRRRVFSAILALPAIYREFSATVADVAWVVTAFNLALAVAAIPAATLVRRVGAARLCSAGLLVFAVASLACAIAPSLGVLIGARALQGLAGAGVDGIWGPQTVANASAYLQSLVR